MTSCSGKNGISGNLFLNLYPASLLSDFGLEELLNYIYFLIKVRSLFDNYLQKSA